MIKPPGKKKSIRITVHHRVVHAVAVPVEVLCEVGGLHEGIGREETADHRVVEAGVGIDDLEAVVVLVAGEAAPEGERDRGLFSVPTRIIHAVAPGVEMGLLDDGLALVHHLVPAAEVVGEDVIEAVGVAVLHMQRHHTSLGIDVVEMAGGRRCYFFLVKLRDAGHLLLQGAAGIELGIPPHAVGAVVQRDAVAVLGDGSGPVAEVVGGAALRRGNGARGVARDAGDGMGLRVAIAVGPHLGVRCDVARVGIAEAACGRPVHLIGSKPVESVIEVSLRLADLGVRPGGDEASVVVGVVELAVLVADVVFDGLVPRGVGDGVGGLSVDDVAVADRRQQAVPVVGVLHARAVAVAAHQGLAELVARVLAVDQVGRGGVADRFQLAVGVVGVADLEIGGIGDVLELAQRVVLVLVAVQDPAVVLLPLVQPAEVVVLIDALGHPVVGHRGELAHALPRGVVVGV